MDLERIFKAYDVRGTYPDQIDEDAAYRIGRAFAVFSQAKTIAVGRDMRDSSVPLANAFVEGVTKQGADVIDLGLVATDELYFASGKLDVPGAMFTASHNPAQYNGIKFCLAGAKPVGQDTGLAEIKEKASINDFTPAQSTGKTEARDMLGEYIDHVLGLVSLDQARPLTVAVDTANGMGGLTVPATFERIPNVKLIPLYLELDGTFPNHPADPIQPENLRDLKKTLLENAADVGLAFDGDADRVFLLDEKGEPVSGSLLAALVAKSILAKHPKEKVVYSIICSRVFPETIEEMGGEPVPCRVGHSFMKEVMAKTGAIFGGEHSGHYYFRDNYRADSGLIAALHVLEALGSQPKPLSEALKPFKRYWNSGEINTEVKDQEEAMERVAAAFPDGEHDHTDGLTITWEDRWLNVRPSNTEPLLRLNVEARDQQAGEALRDRALAIIR